MSAGCLPAKNILTDAGCINQVSYDTPVIDNNTNVVNLSVTDEEDVYGDYESEPEIDVQITTVKEVLNVNDASGIIQKLIEIFQATD